MPTTLWHVNFVTRGLGPQVRQAAAAELPPILRPGWSRVPPPGRDWHYRVDSSFCWDCPVHCRMFCDIPGLSTQYLPVAQLAPAPQKSWRPNCVQTWPQVSLGSQTSPRKSAGTVAPWWQCWAFDNSFYEAPLTFSAENLKLWSFQYHMYVFARHCVSLLRILIGLHHLYYYLLSHIP